MAKKSVAEKLKNNEYNNTLDCPTAALTRTQLEKFEKIKIDSSELTQEELTLKLNEHKRRIDSLVADRTRSARDAYYAESKRLNDMFKQDALVELGLLKLGAYNCELYKHPKADMLYDKAWELGHSSGLSDVWDYMFDLVDLVK